SAVGPYLVMIHAAAEIPKSASRPSDRLIVEKTPGKGVMPQAHRGAFVVENLDVMGRGGPRDHQPNRVRTRVNCCQLDRCGHLVPNLRKCGRRTIVRVSNPQLRGDSFPQRPVDFWNTRLAVYFYEPMPVRQVVEF